MTVDECMVGVCVLNLVAAIIMLCNLGLGCFAGTLHIRYNATCVIYIMHTWVHTCIKQSHLGINLCVKIRITYSYVYTCT